MMTFMYMSHILNSMQINFCFLIMMMFWSKYNQNFENDSFLEKETFKRI